MEEEEARRAQQLLLHGHHHWSPSSWSPQPASYVAPFCCCFVVVVLPPPPSPWRICLTNAPWMKRYKKKPPAGDTCSSGPTECQFLLLCCRYGFLLCFPFQPTFSSCFCCCCSHEPSLKALRYPAIFLQLVPDVH